MKKINLKELRQMRDKGGLVLQGCGGELQEWVDGINKLLTDEGILKNGSAFHEVYSFENKGLTCLLFDMKGVNLDVGRLAIWRLNTREVFGGMWLEDYLDNRVGMESVQETVQKPDCELIGQDGNIFNLMGIAVKTLRRNGMADQAKEMKARIIEGSCGYYDALNIIGEYVNITGPEEEARVFLEQARPASYTDKNGNPIREGMFLQFDDGSVEEVFACMDADGGEDLGINASNEAYLERHRTDREYYPLSNFPADSMEILGQRQDVGQDKKEEMGMGLC